MARNTNTYLLALSCSVGALMSLTATRAQATSVTYSGSEISFVSGALLSASAQFETSGSDLIITLTNTSAADVLHQADVLSAVFFDVSGPLLGLNSATGSAVLGGTSMVLFDAAPAGGVVGGEWGYGEGISGGLSANSGGLLTYNYGISSAGFGVFGGATFPGPNLDPPAALDGINYGITSAGDNPLTGQSAVTGANPLIQNQVVFTLTGLPMGFSLGDLGQTVWFQYGTALSPSDPGYPGIPAPGVLSLLILGGLGMRRRSRR